MTYAFNTVGYQDKDGIWKDKERVAEITPMSFSLNREGVGHLWSLWRDNSLTVKFCGSDICGICKRHPHSI